MQEFGWAWNGNQQFPLSNSNRTYLYLYCLVSVILSCMVSSPVVSCHYVIGSPGGVGGGRRLNSRGPGTSVTVTPRQCNANTGTQGVYPVILVSNCLACANVPECVIVSTKLFLLCHVSRMLQLRMDKLVFKEGYVTEIQLNVQQILSP